MNLREVYHTETVRMPNVLLGVASAAIAFAFHETSNRKLDWPLALTLLAVLLWAGSFASGVMFSRSYTFGIKLNIGMNETEAANLTDLKNELESRFTKIKHRSGFFYQAQQWLLLWGAVAYLGGHAWHLATIPQPQPNASAASGG